MTSISSSGAASVASTTTTSTSSPAISARSSRATTAGPSWRRAEILATSGGAAPPRATVAAQLTGTAIERRRFLRTRVYQRFPLFVRPFLFWFYGYVLRRGFLDGIEGLVFHTLQRFWFRFLIDAKIWELQRPRSQMLEFATVARFAALRERLGTSVTPRFVSSFGRPGSTRRRGKYFFPNKNTGHSLGLKWQSCIFP